jgi:TonB family protein
MRQSTLHGNSSKEPTKFQSAATAQGFLACCMVGADESAQSRAGIARGRAFGISAIAQACLLTLILIVPLFATSHTISVRNVFPIAPYGGMPRGGDEPRPQDNNHHSMAPHKIPMNGIHFHPPSNSVKQNDARDDKNAGDPNEPPNIGVLPGVPNGDSDRIGQIQIPGLTDGPRPPAVELDKKTATGPVKVSEVSELAQIVSRVEPVYPIIAVHSHIEGTVQMRAIIGRDGSVRELHVLSGNAILSYAAQEAVKQWRFRPTMLNGQPVEVDTFFTVVFKINQ